MLRIGDFAKLARVSVKTLHHYDDIDLLKPQMIQAATGYRYYGISQLPRLNRILALKDLGFTLNQVRSILNENPSPSEILAILRSKEEELADLIQEKQERLERVKVRLQQIEREDARHDYDIRVASIEPRTIVSARGIFPITNDTFQQCQELAIRVYTWINQMGSTISGTWCSIYHEIANEDNNERIDIEMAAEVDRSLLMKSAPSSFDLVEVYELPRVDTMACLLYQGRYDGLWDAHTSLMTWLETSGYYSVGSCRCIYLNVPPQGGEPLTELQIPIRQDTERLSF